MKHQILLTLILASLIIKECHGIQLKDIDVPPVVRIEDDDVEPVKLDCEYIVEGNPETFLVQWKKNDQLIYQWIYGQNATPFGYEEDVRIFETSKEPFQEYRGIILVNPTKETTGEYKCIVRSYEGQIFDEKSMSKKLQVVDTSNYTLHLYHRRVENETHIECTVHDVYPEPKMDLTSDDGDEVQILLRKSFKDEMGFYNATLLAVVSDDDDDPDSYICTVMFPGLSVNLTTTAESGSSILRPMVWLLLFAVFLRLR